MMLTLRLFRVEILVVFQALGPSHRFHGCIPMLPYLFWTFQGFTWVGIILYVCNMPPPQIKVYVRRYVFHFVCLNVWVTCN